MTARRGIIIAIDGPAGSGKSTTAKLVATRLGYMHIDTGAMYRAVAVKMLRNGIDLADTERVTALLEETTVEQREQGEVDQKGSFHCARRFNQGATRMNTDFSKVVRLSDWKRQLNLPNRCSSSRNSISA